MFMYLTLYISYIFQYVFLVNNKNTYKNITVIFYKHYCKKVTVIITKIFFKKFYKISYYVLYIKQHVVIV